MSDKAYIGSTNITFDACSTCKFATENGCDFENESPERTFELRGYSIDNLEVICNKYQSK